MLNKANQKVTSSLTSDSWTEQIYRMYVHFHSDHLKLRWPDQSLDRDWREVIGLPFEAGCEVGNAVRWEILHSLVRCVERYHQEPTLSQNPLWQDRSGSVQ